MRRRETVNYNFFIVDDDPSVLAILSKIIVNRNLGDVIGTNQTGDSAVQEIKSLKPDIVIIDLLLPKIDGITLVRQLKDYDPDLPLIMISEVQAKDMVSKAYESGVEFYVNKPINVIEVVNVLKRVDEKISMKQVISSFKNAFQSIGALDGFSENPKEQNQIVDQARSILAEIGVLSEAGAKELLMIVEFIYGIYDKKPKRVMDYRMIDLYEAVHERYESLNESVQTRTIEQRIRRTAAQAMTTIAQMGVEDFEHQYFVRYAHSLFEYKEVRQEMMYIEGQSRDRGKVNIKKFVTGIMQELRYNNQ
nr:MULTISPECIES: response regulator [unclassified Fusibacter]